jgi:hypothetical protein
MTDTHWRAAAAISLLLVSACAGPRPGEDRAVFKPEVRIGDSWVYRSKNHLSGEPEALYGVRVTFADSSVIHGVVTWQDEPETDVTWTSEWNSVTSASEGLGAYDRMGLFDPHSGTFKFPLRADASWKSISHLRLPRRGFFEVRYERTASIAGYEDIEVPAGKFRALKVIVEGRWERLDVAAMRGRAIPTSGGMYTAVWYVPEVKRWVKVVHEESAVVGSIIRREDELVFFKVQ